MSENPYKYTEGENEHDIKPIFYETYYIFLPFTLIMLTFVIPVIINEYIVKIGNYYHFVVIAWIIIFWPFGFFCFRKYLKDRADEKNID